MPKNKYRVFCRSYSLVLWKSYFTMTMIASHELKKLKNFDESEFSGNVGKWMKGFVRTFIKKVRISRSMILIIS